MKNLILYILISTAIFSAQAQKQERDSLDIMIGQMIMVGVMDYYNDSSRQELLQLISDGKVGGIILFEKNLKKENTKNELIKMITELQDNATIPLFMGIDEEGGKVNRLKPKYGFSKGVSAQYLGEIDDPDSTLFYGTQTANMLSELGFNVNYAPTVDVAINPDNPVIAKVERSFSADYKEVIEHAELFIQSHDTFNVATVLKHFPGHGSSAADTHKGVADVSNTWQFEEIYPYQELIKTGNVKAIMTSHIVNRSLDEAMLPATLSKKIITGILRNHLQFNGVVFTDDMHMGAIVKHYGIEEAIILAMNADVDVLMFSNNIFEDERITAKTLHSIIRANVDSGIIDIETVRKSYLRIIELKNSLNLMNEE